MVFLLLSPLWVCRIGKKNHTLSQNNEIRTYYNDLLKNTTLTGSLFPKDFHHMILKIEHYGWASTLEINERKQPRRDSNAHFLLYLTVTIILRRWFFFFPGCQSAVMINLIQVSQCLIVGQRSLTIIILLNPEFEIFPFEVVRAITVLLWFFFLMHLPILTIR